ncbi:glycosyltransferase family 2 protein [Nocardiopsis sp. CT-R113]|uniref:Glycosyltransferase family 2 protein n=1 Tax=Nocardiopsis codii TaxID=3065942 RepID=A0ABU7K6D4_9ACTN|nr:glycosyltransferase family 2 protein [Nocardiopsis sp. CT-R113]MEE2037803.1 glycosyltransferase family 2 protein [Nocardiopsis sp. CT-R113]
MLDVSVVVRAFGGQERLDLTLASLAAQSYPVGLMEVVVVDDGSEPPIRLPEVRPPHTRIVVVPPGGWGPARAVRAGTDASSGAVVLRLDAGIEVAPVHVEAQMRWHHLADHLAVLGGVVRAGGGDGVGCGEPDASCGPEAAEGEWAADTAGADRLRTAGHRAWQAFAGTAWSVRRELLAECGGMDPGLLLGEDTHLGYRLAQRGAVFVPEPAATGRRPGGPRPEDRPEEADRFGAPFLENRVPRRHSRRVSPGREWQVPCVDVVVEVSGVVFEVVSDTVERVLGGDVADVRVTLVGEWRRVSAGGRHAVLDDPDVELRLVREAFRCESRVVFAEEVPRADPDVPFRLFLLAGLPVGSGAVRTLTAAADARDAGVVLVRGTGGGTAAMRLEREAAFARARRLGATGPELDVTVAELWGEHDVDRDEVLTGHRPGEEGPPADWHRRMRRAARAADRNRAAADRWERRIRVLVRGRGVRLLLGRPVRGSRVRRTRRGAISAV